MKENIKLRFESLIKIMKAIFNNDTKYFKK